MLCEQIKVKFQHNLIFNDEYLVPPLRLWEKKKKILRTAVATGPYAKEHFEQSARTYNITKTKETNLFINTKNISHEANPGTVKNKRFQGHVFKC